MDVSLANRRKQWETLRCRPSDTAAASAPSAPPATASAGSDQPSARPTAAPAPGAAPPSALARGPASDDGPLAGISDITGAQARYCQGVLRAGVSPSEWRRMPKHAQCPCWYLTGSRAFLSYCDIRMFWRRAPEQVRWHRSLEEVPVDAPAIVLAHEFFDALPVHQFQVCTAFMSLRLFVAVSLHAEHCRAQLYDQHRSAESPLEVQAVSVSRGPFREVLQRTLAQLCAASSRCRAISEDNVPWNFPLAPQLTERGWCERLVDVAPDEDAAHLRFVLSPGPTPASRLLVERRLAALPPEDAAGTGTNSSSHCIDGDNALQHTRNRVTDPQQPAT